MRRPDPFLFFVLILLLAVVLVFLVLLVNYFSTNRLIPLEDRQGFIDQLLDNEEKSPPRSEFSKEGAPPQDEELAREITVTTSIVRGEVTDLNKQTGMIVVRNDHSATKETQSLDASALVQFKCWPEFSQTSSGQQVLLRTAYIPFEPATPISWPNERLTDIKSLWNVLEKGSYIFAKLAQPIDNTTSEIKELAVLGCL